MTPTDEILALEDERYNAMLNADENVLERLLHPQLVYMHSSGVADTKGSYIAGLKSGDWDYSRIDRSGQTMQVEGDTALVFNRQSISIKVKGVAKELNNRALAVWIKQDGEWRLIGLQSGALPAGA